MAEIVISDTSCLILYEKISKQDILRETFGQVVVTEEVAKEYGAVPDWIEVRKLNNRKEFDNMKIELGSGEASSIAYALENKNCLLIIDERKGRKRAEELGIKIIGSLGVLLKAKERHVISTVLEVLDEIEKTDFRVSSAIRKKLLEEAGEKSI